MQTEQVNRALSDVKIFRGTFARDKIPKSRQRPSAFVVNTDSHKQPGEHWIAIILLRGRKGEYFDSFGLPPSHQDYTAYLEKLCPRGWIWNNIALQDPEDVTCGNFCTKYIKARHSGQSLEDFLLDKPHLVVQNHH